MKAPSGGTKPDAEWLQSTNILRVSGKEHSGGFVFPAHSERDTVSGKPDTMQNGSGSHCRILQRQYRFSSKMRGVLSTVISSAISYVWKGRRFYALSQGN